MPAGKQAGMTKWEIFLHDRIDRGRMPRLFSDDEQYIVAANFPPRRIAMAIVCAEFTQAEARGYLWFFWIPRSLQKNGGQASRGMTDSVIYYFSNPAIKSCHCEWNEAISPFPMRLPRTLSVLAMTDKSTAHYCYARFAYFHTDTVQVSI
jgi:hypothetical protein